MAPPAYQPAPPPVREPKLELDHVERPALLGRCFSKLAFVVGVVCAACGMPADSPAPGNDDEVAPLPVRHDDAWSGPTRGEPPGPGLVRPWRQGAERFTFTDTIGEPGLFEGIDLSIVEVQRWETSDDGRGVALYFDLLEALPDSDPSDRTFAYGVVIDVNADGIPDYRIGMDNTLGGKHREWISNLAMGQAAINPGPGYGWAPLGTGQIPISRGRRRLWTWGGCRPLSPIRGRASTSGHLPSRTEARPSPTTRPTQAG
jgi:hypothetical protein